MPASGSEAPLLLRKSRYSVRTVFHLFFHLFFLLLPPPSKNGTLTGLDFICQSSFMSPANDLSFSIRKHRSSNSVSHLKVTLPHFWGHLETEPQTVRAMYGVVVKTYHLAWHNPMGAVIWILALHSVQLLQTWTGRVGGNYHHSASYLPEKLGLQNRPALLTLDWAPMGSKQEWHSLEGARNPHSNTHNHLHECVHHIERNKDHKPGLSVQRYESASLLFLTLHLMFIVQHAMKCLLKINTFCKKAMPVIYFLAHTFRKHNYPFFLVKILQSRLPSIPFSGATENNRSYYT